MRWLLALVCLIIFGCSKPIKQQTKFQVNVDSLLKFHKNQLSNQRVILTKWSSINGNQSSVEIQAQDIQWDVEFEPFKILGSINKPIYSNAYEIEVRNDDKSNLIIKSWTSNRSLPLQQLRVYFLKDFKQIKKVEAIIVQQNFIFNSIKELSLNFSVLGTYPVAEDYKIEGHQKFIWEEPQYFSLTGNIHVK